MRKTLLTAAAALVISAPTLSAQDAPKFRPEIRPFAGTMLNTGSQANILRNGSLYGVQAAVEFKEVFHVVATFAKSSLKTTVDVTDQAAEMMSYDFGIEYDGIQPIGKWQMKPFVGVGAGERNYDFKSAQLYGGSHFASYLALGTEFQLSRFAFRLEGRGNIFGFHEPYGNADSMWRNDMTLSFGLAYHIR